MLFGEIDMIIENSPNIFDTKYFYTLDGKIKNLGSIDGLDETAIGVGNKLGWDYAIFHEIYNLRDYERPNQVEIRKDDVVVDLGGNIGVFTRYAYQQGASKILTFEPDKRYFEVLSKNAPDNTILINGAIGDTNSKMEFIESSHLGGSGFFHPDLPGLTKYEVDVYTLDGILEKKIIENIDFLKVDIEGSEIIALNGISDQNLSKIRNVVMEYHNAYFGYDDSIRERVIQRFVSLGFTFFVLFCGNDNSTQLLYFWK